MGKNKEKAKKHMSEQTGKIVKTMVITLVVLALAAGAIVYAVLNSSETRILGTWQASNQGYDVTIEFTDTYENPSTKETLCYVTFKAPDGTTETEKATYNISNESVITLRPVDENIKDSATAEFRIEGKKLICQYTRDFEQKEFTLEKVDGAKTEEAKK